MEGNLLKSDTYTAEYQFAKDIVRKVIEMRCIYMLKFRDPELDNAFSTVEKKLLSVDWKRLDEHITRFTNRNGRLNYGDRRFLLCIEPFIEEYKPELQSKDEFLLVCSKIVYAAECFLRNNDQSDAIALAVDRVYELLIDTFYPTMINEEGSLTKFVRDQKYCFAYDVVKKLFKLRGYPVPDLELLGGNNDPFSSIDRIEIQNMLNQKQWTDLKRLLKSFTHKDGKFDCSVETLSRCMDKIVNDFKPKQNSIEDLRLLSARIAYIAWALRGNSVPKAIDLAVNRIYNLAQKSEYFNSFKQDDDYLFSRDLVTAMFEMSSNPFSVEEMSQPGSSFFMIAHRNKIQDHLSQEKFHLDEIVRKFMGEDESSDYKDDLFLSCLDKIMTDYKPDNKTREGLVQACARIAYVAASFLRKNNRSNAPGLAMDRMLKIVKDINRLPYSEVLILRPKDDHYRFAYDLVKAVLDMKNIPVQDANPPDADNFLFTDQFRNKIENLLSLRLSELDKVVRKLTLCFDSSDFSDRSFIECMKEIKREEYDKKTEEGLLYMSVKLSYLSAFFIKKNCQSKASLLATNRIYELIKESNFFCDSKQERILMANTQDDNYRFVHDLTTTVLKMKDIPVSPLVLPELDNQLFTDAHRNKIQDLIRKEKFKLDEMMENLVEITGCFNYSDDEFLHCMNQIVEDRNLTSEDEFVYVCGIIAYTAAFFLIKNCKSKAIFLAVNRMYEMSKDVFCNKNVEDGDKEEKYNIAYDLVTAVLRIINHSSFKFHIPDLDVSPFTKKNRNVVQDYLSREWPYLHHVVRRFTKRCQGMEFCDGHFLFCIQQIRNDNKSDQKSEKGLLLVTARIAYVAACFQRKNRNSNATDLALACIYQMRKNFVYVPDEYHRFACDLVRKVVNWARMPTTDEDTPDTSDNYLLTCQNRKKIPVLDAPDTSDKSLLISDYNNRIDKLLKKGCNNIKVLIEGLIREHWCVDFDDDFFVTCMDEILEVYKHEQANADDFVRLCGKIAYAASHFIEKKKASNVITLAVRRIRELARDSVHFKNDLDCNKLEYLIKAKLRFLYDLVKKVVEMEPLPYVKFLDPETFVLTDELKERIEQIPSKDGPELDILLKKHLRADGKRNTSTENFKACMDEVIKKYKAESYTEEGFLLLCARLAHVKTCHFKIMENLWCKNVAISRINTIFRNLK